MLRRHRRVHRLIWIGLATLLPVLLVASALLRPRDEADRAPIRLSPPATESAP